MQVVLTSLFFFLISTHVFPASCLVQLNSTFTSIERFSVYDEFAKHCGQALLDKNQTTLRAMRREGLSTSSDGSIALSALQKHIEIAQNALREISNTSTEFTKRQLCEKLERQPQLLSAIASEMLVFYTTPACRKLNKIGLPCKRFLNDTDVLYSLKSDRYSKDDKMFAFLEAASKIPNLNPNKHLSISRGKNITNHSSQLLLDVSIKQSVRVGEGFQSHEDWITTKTKIDQALQQIWSQDDLEITLKDVTGTNQMGIEVKLTNDLPNEIAVAIANPKKNYIAIRPTFFNMTDERQIHLLAHEMGHILGFPETYGYFMNDQIPTCDLGYFYSKGNIMSPFEANTLSHPSESQKKGLVNVYDYDATQNMTHQEIWNLGTNP